jgi:hypothetical protein
MGYNPHKIPDGCSYYTYDKERALAVSATIPNTHVDRYTLGDDRPHDTLPWAVWTKNNGAVLINWVLGKARGEG